MHDRYVIVCRLREDAVKKQEEEEERLQQEKDQETTWYRGVRGGMCVCINIVLQLPTVFSTVTCCIGL